MKVYTKKGDEGQTSLIGGTRVPKHHIRIEAYGTVDELNSWLGYLRDNSPEADQVALLQEIQSTLFTLGSHLASDPDKSKMKLPELHKEDVEKLENSIDKFEESLPQLTNFVLPGGLSGNSIAHIARCVCRRAERHVVLLNENSPLDPLFLTYLNRLSDWLFVYSRYLSHKAGATEILWKPRG